MNADQIRGSADCDPPCPLGAGAWFCLSAGMQLALGAAHREAGRKWLCTPSHERPDNRADGGT